MMTLREQAKQAATAPHPVDEWGRLLPWGIEERIDAASDVWASALSALLKCLPSKDLSFEHTKSYHVCEHGCTLMKMCDYHTSIAVAKESVL
jgi:hypothetical protein